MPRAFRQVRRGFYGGKAKKRMPPAVTMGAAENLGLCGRDEGIGFLRGCTDPPGIFRGIGAERRADRVVRPYRLRGEILGRAGDVAGWEL